MSRVAVALVAAATVVLHPCTGFAADPPLVRSAGSGPWSAASTWVGDKVPAAGARVQVRAGHRVVYDLASETVIRSIHVAGVLSFAPDRDTRLDIGLIKIQPGDDADESGFDCDAHAPAKVAEVDRPALEVGTPDRPIDSDYTALIRLTPVPGLDKETCPAIVCCGGRMDLHGAPMAQTWVKLDQMARAGEPKVVVPFLPAGWKVGDRLLVVGTSRQVGYLGTRKLPTDDTVRGKQSSEVRTVTGIKRWNDPNRQIITFDKPLDYEHRASGEYRAEVANLSRNVVIESADPASRGHTMYHRNSAGAISYAEFRHLGKEGILGKYPIHYHQCGDTMRGSYVLGASVWDSGNRWVTIHGTRYLIVRDCVGYDSVGHGFFLEDGTETFNVLDRNLAVLAGQGKPLPKQVLPFDRNLGSGFWWANSLNTFTRNVAAECDADGFRFEVVKTKDFDPVLTITRADGTKEPTDIRTLPFVRFEDNEAHAHRLFGFNMGGFNVTDFGKPNADVGGVGPDARHPFVVRKYRVWDAHWGYHTGCPRVIFEGGDFFDCLYGMWRCVLDGHDHRDVTYTQTRTPLFFPRHAAPSPTGGIRPYPEDQPVDDLPPATVVTRIESVARGVVRVRGTTTDDNDVKVVTVNGVPARTVRPNFAEWEVELYDVTGGEVEVTARAEDVAGNVEPRPHICRVRPGSVQTQVRRRD